MISIRQGTFETNSSSTHSMVMMSEDTYKEWRDGEVYLNKVWFDSASQYKDKDFVTLEEIQDIYEKSKYDFPEVSADEDEYLYEVLSEELRDDGFYSFELWGSDLEHETKSYTTASGEVVVCESYFGYDG